MILNLKAKIVCYFKKFYIILISLRETKTLKIIKKQIKIQDS